MTPLSPEQQSQARQWIADGMKLSDFQRRIEADFGIRLTYMEVRFLVDDLKVVPKDPEPPKAPEPPKIP
jgi:transposase